MEFKNESASRLKDRRIGRGTESICEESKQLVNESVDTMNELQNLGREEGEGTNEAS
jgi:hypothetical protein